MTTGLVVWVLALPLLPVLLALALGRLLQAAARPTSAGQQLLSWSG